MLIADERLVSVSFIHSFIRSYSCKQQINRPQLDM